jgi:hypothetical protein
MQVVAPKNKVVSTSSKQLKEAQQEFLVLYVVFM